MHTENSIHQQTRNKIYHGMPHISLLKKYTLCINSVPEQKFSEASQQSSERFVFPDAHHPGQSADC